MRALPCPLAVFGLMPRHSPPERSSLHTLRCARSCAECASAFAPLPPWQEQHQLITAQQQMMAQGGFGYGGGNYDFAYQNQAGRGKGGKASAQVAIPKPGDKGEPGPAVAAAKGGKGGKGGRGKGMPENAVPAPNIWSKIVLGEKPDEVCLPCDAMRGHPRAALKPTLGGRGAAHATARPLLESHVSPGRRKWPSTRRR